MFISNFKHSNIIIIIYRTLNQINQPKHPLAQPPGPNGWDLITDKDFGNEFDFELYENYHTTVFYPVSKAALQWSYRFLPSDCPRWRGVGFVVENRFIALVCRQARMDKLVSLDDAENENESQRLQREPT